ncbi:hypothetical protein CTI12_AA564180 [Artemisia annua]|uniref:BED-type domain-containing protein n=1 Tax=Artemisia annua TaxID=35608 RepID=A0A2U1KU58_ARTAN|nr:hypothetical protein CTI12_AA564180 [Artemisia annua]
MSTSMTNETFKQEVPDQTKGRARDQAWAYVTPCVRERGQQVLICNFCDKVFRGGGINRLKKHLAGIKGEGAECSKVNPDVKEAIEASMKDDKHTENDDEEQVGIKGIISF